MRDAFIDEICDVARTNPDVYFISADFGAPALDRFRRDLPDQFIHAGISEQNMIDMAAGLALSGKAVYTYAMAPFITLRCFEQLKCALGLMKQPVTVVGVGVGLGYADSGPTHYTTEDIACMRALTGIEVLSPADGPSTTEIARLTLREPAFRYIRLDRQALPPIHGDHFARSLADGFCEVEPGEQVCIFASGYMLHRALEARRALNKEGIRPGVVDMFRIKPIGFEALGRLLARYDRIVTVEEQCLAGGFGSAILEAMADNDALKPVRRLGLPERNYFENGGRDYLLDRFGLSVEAICESVART